LADAHPAVTCALVGHDRLPKQAYQALVDACRPVIVVADWPPPHVAPGAALALDVHVVSDRHEPVTSAEVTARLSWDGGNHARRWRGDVAADSCVRTGTVSFVVPDAPGRLTLDLELIAGDVAATNRYESTITPN